MTEYSMMTEHSKPITGYEEIEGNKPNAAVMIHSRTRYRDYREGLLVRPADMTDEQVYQWKKQVLCCTREPEEMRAGHQVRRAVIGDGVYAAAGVAAYFRDIASGSFEDEGRRPAYGFVGFVWKIDSGFRPFSFPSMADFRYLTERYVVPRWEEPKNAKDAEKATLSAYNECWDGASGNPELSERQKISGQPEPSEKLKPDKWPEPGETDSEISLKQALERVMRGANVFYCTGLPEQMREQKADYRYQADSGAGKPMEISDSMPGDASKHRLIWAVAAAGLLCGAVIWMMLFR